MNERIDNLMVKAGAYFGGEGVDYSNFDPKKFAVLIIRECAIVAIEKQTENDVLNIVSKNPAKDFAYALIEHFGVEE
jgi:hypothetical protein